MINKGPPFLKKLFCFSVRNERIGRAVVIFVYVVHFFNSPYRKKKQTKNKKNEDSGLENVFSRVDIKKPTVKTFTPK